MTVLIHVFALAAAFVFARLLWVSKSSNDPQYMYTNMGDVRGCIVQNYPL
jgi:hypothetical protein